jgi:hypothetical protein
MNYSVYFLLVKYFNVDLLIKSHRTLINETVLLKSFGQDFIWLNIKSDATFNGQLIIYGHHKTRKLFYRRKLF